MSSSWWSTSKKVAKAEADWRAAETDWMDGLGNLRQSARRSRRIDALTESFSGFLIEYESEEESGSRIYNRRLPVAVPPFAALHGELRQMLNGEFVDSLTFQLVKVSRAALARDMRRIDSSRMQKAAEVTIQQRHTPPRVGITASGTESIRRRPSSRLVDRCERLDLRPNLRRQFSTGSIFYTIDDADNQSSILMPSRHETAATVTVAHINQLQEKTKPAVCFSTPKSNNTRTLMNGGDTRPKSLRRPSAAASAQVRRNVVSTNYDTLV
uniref:Uncharacterized protein n=1 Tax=Aureoumbra lagunensis TaxID=44058 RepID=A0A7S3K2T7_9STRA